MKYDIIYIDPPWMYNRTGGQACVTKYKRMKDTDVYTMPIGKLANENCALICWMTYPKIEEGCRAVRSWGFEIKTVFTNWIKTNPKAGGIFFGVGSYTKSNGEFALLCAKGNIAQLRPPKEERDNTISSVLMAPRGEHSSKPNAQVMKNITTIFGNRPRIEIFARERVPGWDAIGYDIDKLDIKESLARQISL